MATYRFIEPVDVLYLRGNRLFGDPGSHGAALMPPWPSLAAGALRSHLLVTHGIDPSAYAAADQRLPEMSDALHACLGTPAKPGTFRISMFTLALRTDGQVQPLFPLPADVVVREQDGAERATYLRPTTLAPALACSYAHGQLPLLPALRDRLDKPKTDLWLNTAGLTAYLEHWPLTSAHWLRQRQVWKPDHRLGITLDGNSRTVATGMLYTAEIIALGQNVGFLVGVAGAADLLPEGGLLRFGGDGRGARLSKCKPNLHKMNLKRIVSDRRFRLILATPGLFPEGWRLPGLLRTDTGWYWSFPGGSARLVATAINRADVVSGWDLAQWQPKSAQRVAPVGTVYWLDELTGGQKPLRRLLEHGLDCADNCADPSRRAEGFSNVLIAAWPRKES